MASWKGGRRGWANAWSADQDGWSGGWHSGSAGSDMWSAGSAGGATEPAGSEGGRWPRRGHGKGSKGKGPVYQHSPTSQEDSSLLVQLEQHKLDAGVLSSFVLCPDPGKGGFTATYESSPPVEQGFASVNAGSGRDLRLGGSGLNGQFARDLARAGMRTDAFRRTHQALMSAGCRDPGRLVRVDGGSAGLAAVYGRVASTDGSGFVAIDIFPEGSRPLHPANVAMVYCVGPDRRELVSDEAFLASIHRLGESLALACGEYNITSTALDLTLLRRVRVALVSGGKYSGSVPPDMVACWLLRGLAVGASAASTGAAHAPEAAAASVTIPAPVYELAFADGCFQRALQGLLLEASGSGDSGGGA